MFRMFVTSPNKMKFIALAFSVAFLLTAAEPQEKDKEKASAFRLDRAVESWYKINRGEKHIGFMHTKVLPDAAASGYQYSFEVETNFLDEKQTTRPLSYSGQALLNDDFIPVKFTSTLTTEERSITFMLTLEGGIKRIRGEVRGGPANLEWHLDADEEVFVDLQSVLFAMKRKGELDQKTEKEVRIAIPNNATVSRTGKIESKGREKKEYLNTEINALCGVFPDRLEIYPGFEAAEYAVDNYGRFLEIQNGSGTESIVIVHHAAEAKGAAEIISEKGRANPFDKKRAIKKSGEEAPRKKETPKEEIKSNVDESLPKLERLKKDIVKSKGNEQKAKELRAAFMEIYERLRKDATKVIVDHIDDLKKQVDEVYTDVHVITDEAKKVFEDLKANAKNMSLPEVASSVDRIRQLSRNPSLISTPQLDVVRKYAESADAIYTRQQNYLIVKNRNIDISGIFYYLRNAPLPVSFKLNIMGYPVEYSETVYVPIPSSYAIINAKTVKKGDLVDNCIVKEILEDGIVLSYQDEEYKFPLKKKQK